MKQSRPSGSALAYIPSPPRELVTWYELVSMFVAHRTAWLWHKSSYSENFYRDAPFQVVQASHKLHRPNIQPFRRQVCTDEVTVAAIFKIAISGNTEYLDETEVSWPAFFGLVSLYPNTNSTTLSDKLWI